ncbi:hypothetical protein ES703_02215 [subsurface metagenome]
MKPTVSVKRNLWRGSISMSLVVASSVANSLSSTRTCASDRAFISVDFPAFV